MDSPWFAASNGRTFVVMNADTRDALVVVSTYAVRDA